jgi:hypothetical protein
MSKPSLGANHTYSGYRTDGHFPKQNVDEVIQSFIKSIMDSQLTRVYVYCSGPSSSLMTAAKIYFRPHSSAHLGFLTRKREFHILCLLW